MNILCEHVLIDYICVGFLVFMLRIDQLSEI